MKKMLICMTVLMLCLQTFSLANIKGEKAQEALKYAEPIMDNLLTGFNEKDYKKYSQDFDANLSKAMNESSFLNVHKVIIEKIGLYKSRKAMQFVEQGEFKVLIYRAEFAQEKGVTIRTIFKKYGEKNLLAGLWFDSPKLRNQKTLSPEEQQAILKYAEPMVDNLLESLQSANHKNYTRDFDANAKKALSEGVFAQAQQKILSIIGAYKSRKVIKVTKQAQYAIVIHSAVFEKDKQVTIQTIFSQKDNKMQISGHVLDSPTLRGKPNK